MNPETPATPPVRVPEVVAASTSPGSNGGPPLNNPAITPASSRLPRRAHGWSSQRKILTGACVTLVGVLAVGWVLWWTGVLFGKAPFTGSTWTVRKERLKVTIVARGSLESANYGDIYCKVRSGTKGSTIATTIRTLVDAGTEVNEGDEVMTLDFSGFEEQKKDKIKDVKQAYAAKVQADQQVAIQELDNQNDILQAKNKLELAVTDFEKYQKGDYLQALDDVNGRIKTAKSDLEDWKDRAAWSARMYKKKLMSKVQADADASRVDAAEINVQKLEKEKEVLVDFTKGRTETDLKAKVVEAELGVKKAELQAKFKLDYLKADQATKNAIYDLETTRLDEIQDQIENCKVRSPQSGLVVYYVPEQVRGGGGSQQSIVAQGEPVREGQKMLQIPDLDDMLVNVRVPEAFVSHLKGERKSQSKWQKATIKVDAFQTRLLEGHVSFVDTVASVQDWFATDVKVYKTFVSVDIRHKLTDDSLAALRHEHLPEAVLANLDALKDREFANRKALLAELCHLISRREPRRLQTFTPILKQAKDKTAPSLKPGMSAEVTITAEESTEPVLVIPVQSVVGTITMGTERKCFVVGPDGQPVLRDIQVGKSNERLVEVKSGLAEGDKVVENPRPLLEEGSDMRPGKAKGGKDDNGYDKGGKGGGAPKGGGSPGGGGPGGGGPGGGGGAPGGGGGKGQKVGALAPQLFQPADRAWVASAAVSLAPTAVHKL
jgi:multidrug efflux pump subunit AcrA (membrane-fusion protein)